MDFLSPLHSWPPALKKLVFTFVLVSFLGVVVGGVLIEVTTHVTPDGIVEQYKGQSTEQMGKGRELKFPKPVKDMLITTHNHILGLSTIFLIVGFLYLVTAEATRLRVFIAIEPFISLILTFGGLWVVRYLWPPFVYVVILSGILMIATFAWMSIVIMRECLVKKPEG